MPKSVFQQRADTFTPNVIFILRFCSFLFYPILIVFSFLTRVLAKIAGDNAKKPFTLREEIVTMLQMPAAEAGDIQPVEQNMIRRMFNFSETTVGDVMRPLIEVTAVEQRISCDEAREISALESHIRLPVYDDRIVGILHTLDLLSVDPDQSIREYIRPALYVPASKSIKELMLDLRKEGTVVAIVVDEFGGAEGIVTMEEVVKDLEDEYDGQEASDPLIQRLGEKEYIVSARIELDELCDRLKIDLPKGRYATLAGLILEKTHAVPSRGTTIRENGISLIVHRSTARAVMEVRICW